MTAKQKRLLKAAGSKWELWVFYDYHGEWDWRSTYSNKKEADAEYMACEYPVKALIRVVRKVVK